jgi:hypothetical protein
MKIGDAGRSLVVFSLSLAVVLSIFFIIAGAQRTNAVGPDHPDNIYLTWNEDNTAHTIVITWKTVTDSAGDNVKYDTQSRGGVPENYAYSAVGNHHIYSGAYTGTVGWVHDVELTGLSPNTIYYFICGGDTGGWSAERSFRTAPDNGMAFRFVAGGDSRSGARTGSFPGEPDWPIGRDSVSQAMAAWNPSFVLFSGDFVMNDTYQWEWDNWFHAAMMYWIDTDNLTIPIIPTQGNHDYSSDSGTAYFGQFSLPGAEQYYSLDWGPNLHITVLDTETGVSGSGPQYDWLKNDLATHENYLWKVVLFHEPYFSNGPDALNTNVRNYWVPLFDQYHVDLVITGHEHLYERTYPINYTVSQNTPMPLPQEGTIYITSGGWGAPLYTAGTSWYTAFEQLGVYHFVVVDIDNGTLQLKAVDTGGNVFDTYTITKTSWPYVSISPSSQNRVHGNTLDYTVTVINSGIDDDNYVLTATDNKGWPLMLADNLFLIPAGGNITTNLTVTVPGNAAYGTVDNITVTATSAENDNVRDNASITARSAINSCKLSISPAISMSKPGENATFTVQVKNTSDDNAFRDNYTLIASDSLGWQLLIDNIENVLAGENKAVTLTVVIPGDAPIGTRDNISVTAISSENSNVKDNGSGVAVAALLLGTAKIRLASGTAPLLWGIRKVNVTINLLLAQGDNLHLIFLANDNVTVESDNVIWSRTTPVTENVSFTNLVVPHDNNLSWPAGGSPAINLALVGSNSTSNVKRVKLVLTDNTGTVILDNMAWFKVVQDDWSNRISWIILNWGNHNSPQQDQLSNEISQIIIGWGSVPTVSDQHDFTAS